MARMFGEMSLREARGIKGADYLDPDCPLKETLDFYVGLPLKDADAILTPPIAQKAKEVTGREYFTDIRQGGVPIIKVNTLVLDAVNTGSEPSIGPEFSEIDLVSQSANTQERVIQGVTDSRATKETQELRDWCLDELPQARFLPELHPIDKARGMVEPQKTIEVDGREVVVPLYSVVGPRPYMPEDLEEMEAASSDLFAQWQETASCEVLKPGLTSRSSSLHHRWARSSQNSALWVKRMELDIAYLDRACLVEDIRIIMRTPYDVLASKFLPRGEYTNPIAEQDLPKAA